MLYDLFGGKQDCINPAIELLGALVGGLLEREDSVALVLVGNDAIDAK